jgi:hypothetical protein
VTCPYSEPNCAPGPAASASQRCQCGRFTKRCHGCGATNRAFANFCRACGTALTAEHLNWSGYRGGPRRLGFNAAAPDGSASRPTAVSLRLGDECRSLLGYDGHLVAVSLAGVVEIADMARGSVCRFQVPGPITVEPCIHAGVLYVGTRGQLAAYSIPPLTFALPRVRPLWQMSLSGTPIQALTAVGARLYLTVASSGWREVQVIEQLGGARPAAARGLHGAPKMSWIAADPSSDRAVFLSESEERGIQMHVSSPELVTRPTTLRTLAEHPIAFLGGAVFGVFGEKRRLYRIDAATGAVEEPLDEDTQFFALSSDANEEWSRDGVLINTDGVTFSHSGVRDSFDPYERAVRGSPLIVRDSAAFIGMEDGRVRIYDFARLPRHDVWRVGNGSGASITALASFGSFVAAGNKEGVVEVLELCAEEAAS